MSKLSKHSRVAVVGGGIGGLCAAALLDRRGVDVTVFEQATEFREVGAGLQISPNGVKVLKSLGLEGALEQHGVRPLNLVLRGWKTGITVSRTGIAGDFDAAYGAPYYHIHRADLLAMLVESVGSVPVRRGHRLTGMQQDGDGVELDFSGRRERFDAVIGADGIHSEVRRALQGPAAPRFTGNVAFRAMVPADAEMRRRVPVDSTIWLGPGGHVVHYYVRGGTMLNIVAIYETDRWTDESWTKEADPADLLRAFEGWNGELLRTLRSVTHVNRWALYDRDPLPTWGEGVATLLGDAAHPMLPFFAQGAVMAIEDAYVLAESLSGDSSVADALRTYEAARMKRTAKLQLAARARGRSMHVEGRWNSLRRNAKLFFESRLHRDDQLQRGQSLYGFDVTTIAMPATGRPGA
jgi:salicylate hydroxylase